jgi:SAM-dependent methyltransferase
MKNRLDKNYWDTRYQRQETGWDVGAVSIPLKAYIDQLSDKNISILIPGCGNAYEAEYLLAAGFTNVTLIDISPSLVETLKEKFTASEQQKILIICADFFELDSTYDLVLEQTFFCALDPALRAAYAEKMYALLKPGGKVVGVLFDRGFEGGPPFGGSKMEYERLFAKRFTIKKMEACYNSIGPRSGSELFIILEKR